MTAVQINNHPSNPLPPSRAKNRKSQNPHMEPGSPLEAVPVEGLGWGRGSQSWKCCRGSSSGGAGGDHLGTTLFGTNLSPSPQRSPRPPSLQAFRPHAPPPRPELSGRLQTRPPGDGVTAVSSWYLSGLGNLLHPVNPNIVLDFIKTQIKSVLLLFSRSHPGLPQPGQETEKHATALCSPSLDSWLL